MINIQFFPSRWIAIYLARTFLLRTFAVLIALVLVLQTLDLLGESGRILAHPGNGDGELWHYVGLRMPQLIARFLPFSVLLGTLITLAAMSSSSEVVAMKAAGISAHQIIAPLIAASLGVATIAFVFQERVVTRATASLNDWTAVDYGAVPPRSDVAANVWVRDGDDLFLAQSVRGHGVNTRLGNVTVYERVGGTLARIITAEEARPVEGGWRLDRTSTFDVAKTTAMAAPRLVFGSDIQPDRFTLAKVNPDELGFFELKNVIAEVETAGRSANALRAGLWHKISQPLSAILMPLLAGIAAFGLARSGQLFVRAVIGMGLGFAYFVADNFALAMGNLGAYPPLMAAWAPFVLFLLVGETVLLRTEE